MPLRPRGPSRSSRPRRCRNSSPRSRTTDAPVLLDFGPVVGTNVAFSASSSAARCSSRICRRHRSRTPASQTRDALPASRSPGASRRPTPASTACCAGTSSTTSSRRPAQGAGARARAGAPSGRRGDRLLLHQGSRARALHQVRDRRRARALCGIATIPAPAAPSSSCRTATSSGCSTACSSPNRSC